MAAYVLDAILLFGDSITQGSFEPSMNGIGQRLSHVYSRKLDVLNRGLSGYNTDWAFPVLEQSVAKQHDQQHLPKLQLLTIWFGANDSCLEHSPQHVPLDKFKENLRKMIQLVKSPTSPYHSPNTRIILIAPPPVNTHQRGADLASRNPPMKLDRSFEVTKSYADAVLDVGSEESIPVVDAWSRIWDSAGKDEKALSRFLTDGLHLNEAGYKVVYDDLDRTIREKYPEVHHEKLSYVFPPWAEINWADPLSSLANKALGFKN